MTAARGFHKKSCSGTDPCTCAESRPAANAHRSAPGVGTSAASGLRPGWSGDGYYTSIRHLACGECLTLFAPGLSHEKWVEEFERMQADHEEKCDLSNNEGPPKRAFSPNRRDQPR